MSVKVTRFLLVIVLALGLSLSACKKEDDGPTATDNTGRPSDATAISSVQEAQIYTEVAAEQAISFTETAKGFIGFKVAAPQDTTYYSNGWWYNVGSIDYASYLMDYEYKWQFKAGGVVQEDRAGADYAHVVMDLQGTFDQPEYQTSTVLQFNQDMEMTGINTTTATINGDGLYDFKVTVTYSGITQTQRYYIVYTYNDLQVPQNGYPTGEVVIDVYPYTSYVTYDGTNTAHIVIKKDGAIVQEYDYQFTM
jgi:hypothetical protein